MRISDWSSDVCSSDLRRGAKSWIFRDSFRAMHDLTAHTPDQPDTRDDSPPAAAPSGPEMSPMLAHYRACKDRHPDHLLFYRMGDFYQMFFEDALAAAEAPDIHLTKRGQVRAEQVPVGRRQWKAQNTAQ